MPCSFSLSAAWAERPSSAGEEFHFVEEPEVDGLLAQPYLRFNAGREETIYCFPPAGGHGLVDGFAVEEERVSAVTGGLVHVDQVTDMGVHVVDRNVVGGHDLGGDGVVFKFGSLLEEVGARGSNRRGARPDQLGVGGLQALDQFVETRRFQLSGGPGIASSDAGVAGRFCS